MFHGAVITMVYYITTHYRNIAEFFELVAVLRLALHVLVGGEEKAAGANGKAEVDYESCAALKALEFDGYLHLVVVLGYLQ